MVQSLAESEAKEIIAMEKILSVDEISWAEKPQYSAFMRFSARLDDASGISIPNLLAEMEFRVPAKFDSCKYTFSIFKVVDGVRWRAYQLEVVPEADFSHGDSSGNLYGPHEHVGMLVSEVRVNQLDCSHHEKWFREYLSRANIKFWGRYFGPFDGGLFT